MTTPEEKSPADPVPTEPGRALDLSELLSRTVAAGPDRVALVDAGSGRRTTWAELQAEVDRLARGLSGLGLVAGQRVMIAMGNRTEFVATYFAAMRARLVAVPVNPRAATGEMARMIADSGARVVLADHVALSSVRGAAAGLEDALVGADEELLARAAVPRLVVADAPTLPGETRFADLLSDEPGLVPSPQDPEALAVLLYTSGTSGRPRAAMLSQRALVAHVEQAAAVRPPMVTADDVVLGVLPLFHVYGLNAVLGQVVRRGARLVLVDGFDPEGAAQVLEDEAVTVVPLAPAILSAWRELPDLDQRLRGVRSLISGAAPIETEVAEEITRRTGVPVHQGYGLTEAAPAVTSTLCSGELKPGSVGSALPGVELRLVDEQGQDADRADPGEIRVRGANLFSGYWPDGSDGPDADGWWSTGDVGLIDADGDLFLVDRVKELVVVSGFNVYPSEVEDVIDELDGVAEVAVIGEPDASTGEAVVAYLRPEAAAALDEAALLAAVREHCANRLARFKQPSRYEVVADLPHTVTGKVAKGRLRALRRSRDLGMAR